jgi:hypothetical protein
MFLRLLQPAIAFISLSTAVGVLVHDTRIDKVTMTAVSAPFSLHQHEVVKAMDFSGDLHAPHSSRHTVSQVMSDLNTSNPSIHPRSADDKKYMMQKYVARGHHAFDNYNLPLL